MHELTFNDVLSSVLGMYTSINWVATRAVFVHDLSFWRHSTPLGVLKRRLYKLLASLEEGIGELVGALKGLGLLNVV
jgi:hypothetical protein